jgi:gamma-glutamyltranspeptidase
MSLGDPDFVNVTQVIDDLVTGDLIRSLRELTSDTSVLSSISEYGGPDYGVPSTASEFPEDHGTSHVSVLDKDGNAVALTSTVNTYFGSLIISPSTGIVFNNEMDDFSSPNASNYFGLAPFPTNYIEASLPSLPCPSCSRSLPLSLSPFLSNLTVAGEEASLLHVSNHPHQEI